MIICQDRLAGQMKKNTKRVGAHRKPSNVSDVNAYVPMQLPQLLCGPAVTDGFFKVTLRILI